MGYLTHKEKSILFSALTKEEKLCKENGLEDLVLVVKSLEGKFYYNRFEKDIRNKAIDEFSERLKNHLNQFDFWKYGISDGVNCEMRNYDYMIDEIAEQMKKE